MRIPPSKIKKYYQDAIFQVFGCPGDKEMHDHNRYLKAAIKRDVHLAKKAPGEWAPDSTLEIYCENGIPNATDIHDFSMYAVEFGFDAKGAVSYNHEAWQRVDGIVNLLLEALDCPDRYHHEPYNSAVINIYSQLPF